MVSGQDYELPRATLGLAAAGLGRFTNYSSLRSFSGLPAVAGSSMPNIRAIVEAMPRLPILFNSVPGLTPAPPDHACGRKGGLIGRRS